MIVFCSTCGTRFNDTDNTRTCPHGHTTPDAHDEDDWLDYLGKATG